MSLCLLVMELPGSRLSPANVPCSPGGGEKGSKGLAYLLFALSDAEKECELLVSLAYSYLGVLVKSSLSEFLTLDYE